MTVELLTLVVLIPLIAKVLPTKFQRLSSSMKDKYIAEWSLCALAAGQFCLGLAPVIAIAILGMR